MDRIREFVVAAVAKHFFHDGALLVFQYAVPIGPCYLPCIDSFLIGTINGVYLIPAYTHSTIRIGRGPHFGGIVKSPVEPYRMHTVGHIKPTSDCSVCGGRTIGYFQDPQDSDSTMYLCRICWTNPGALQWIGDFVCPRQHGCPHRGLPSSYYCYDIMGWLQMVSDINSRDGLNEATFGCQGDEPGVAPWDTAASENNKCTCYLAYEVRDV